MQTELLIHYLLYLDLIRMGASGFRILCSEGEASCVCFGTLGQVIVAGTEDGSLCAWDLRENSDLHHSLRTHTVLTTNELRASRGFECLIPARLFYVARAW